MRRRDTVYGILLILSIIDFALAIPVPVQEKCKACIDVVHIPHDMITVLGKRGDDEIQRLVEDFFGTWKIPIQSSDAHVSSSSAPPGLDHATDASGSTNVVQATNPGLSMEPPSPSPVQGAWGNPLSEDQWSHNGDDEPLYYTPAPSEYGSDHELTEAYRPQPDPNSEPSADSYLNWNYWVPPLPRPEAQPPPHQTSPGSPKETDNEVMAPPSPDSQLEDPQAAIQAAIRYAAKGKAKELRRIPGTARDVRKWECGAEGAAACERSLDPGV
jgi:hypothetical protein